MTLTIWLEIRERIEKFHSELSQDDMKTFNIRIKKLIYDFCVDESGVSYNDSSELYDLIIDSVPNIIEKIEDKEHFLNNIMLGVKQGIKNWKTFRKTFSKTDKGIAHLIFMLGDTLFDI
jgi:hypothetical protein